MKESCKNWKWTQQTCRNLWKKTGAVNAIYLLELKTLTQVKKELESKNGSENVRYFNAAFELQTLTNDDGATLSEENVQGFYSRSFRNGHEKIFVTGHNSHVAKWGKLLSKGRSKVTMSLVPIFIKPIAICRPVRLKSERVFYSQDPLAKAAKLAGNGENSECRLLNKEK